MSKGLADELRALREARYAGATPHVTPPVTPPRSVTSAVTDVTPTVTGVTLLVTPGIALGDHACPICGLVHHRALTPAAKQRAYRARRKGAT